jgi:hypothetical protein
MMSVSKMRKDDGARRDAISLHDHSILVGPARVRARPLSWPGVSPPCSPKASRRVPSPLSGAIFYPTNRRAVDSDESQRPDAR